MVLREEILNIKTIIYTSETMMNFCVYNWIGKGNNNDYLNKFDIFIASFLSPFHPRERFCKQAIENYY